jgi:hypothetical protein
LVDRVGDAGFDAILVELKGHAAKAAMPAKAKKE